MSKYKMRASNCVTDANWCKVKLTHKSNTTTNSGITDKMFKRECAEFDAGVLPREHDKYLGDANDET